MFKKKPNPEQLPEQKPKFNDENNGRTFKKFGYWLAWISFISAIGMAIFEAVKDKHPPEKNDFYK